MLEYIFMTGPYDSGMFYTGRLLALKPDIILWEETHILRWLFEHQGEIKTLTENFLKNCTENLFRSIKMEDSNKPFMIARNSPDISDKLLGRKTDFIYSNILKSFFAMRDFQDKTKLIIDQSIFRPQYGEFFKKNFSREKYVVLVKDFPNLIASHFKLKKVQKDIESIEYAKDIIKRWNESYVWWKTSKLDVYFISFNNLLKQTKPELRKLHSFLGIGVSDKQYKFIVDGVIKKDLSVLEYWKSLPRYIYEEIKKAENLGLTYTT